MSSSSTAKIYRPQDILAAWVTSCLNRSYTQGRLQSEAVWFDGDSMCCKSGRPVVMAQHLVPAVEFEGVTDVIVAAVGSGDEVQSTWARDLLPVCLPIKNLMFSFVSSVGSLDSYVEVMEGDLSRYMTLFKSAAKHPKKWKPDCDVTSLQMHALANATLRLRQRNLMSAMFNLPAFHDMRVEALLLEHRAAVAEYVGKRRLAMYGLEGG